MDQDEPIFEERPRVREGEEKPKTEEEKIEDTEEEEKKGQEEMAGGEVGDSSEAV